MAKAAADLLSREDNAETTAESLADEIAEAMIETMVSAYEEIQAKSYNLIVVAQFELDGKRYTSAVGPLSTRATQRARDVGARFAWDYKSRKGSGRYTLVPLIRNPNDAWDDARLSQLIEYEGHMGSATPGIVASYEPMRFDLSAETRARIEASLKEAVENTTEPACSCGLDTTLIEAQGKYALCPRHPEGQEGDHRSGPHVGP